MQLPGREIRQNEPAITRFKDLLDTLHEELAPLHNRPVALFGHSLGGLIAFEYARRLHMDGYRAPARLFVSGCLPPNRPRLTELSHLPQADFLREVLHRYEGLPPVIRDDPEMLEYFLPILRADFSLLESYRFVDAPPLDCPLTAMGGDSDRLVGKQELECWRQYTTAQFRSRVFAGGHFYLMQARDAVLATIGTELLELA